MENIYIGDTPIDDIRVGADSFECVYIGDQLIVCRVDETVRTLLYTLAPDSTGWKVSDTGNVVFNSGDTPNGDVYASNHVYLGIGQSINVPVKENTKSITYYSYNDKTHKTIEITNNSITASEELVENWDFSDGLNGWNPSTGDNHTWSHVTPNGCKLDLNLEGEFAICTATLLGTVPANTSCTLKWDTEIINDDGHDTNLFDVQLNGDDIKHPTREGSHEEHITHDTEITSLRLTRALRTFEGVFRNISLKINIVTIPDIVLTESCSNILRLNKTLIQEDLIYLDNNPNCIMEILEDIPHPGITITKQDIIDGDGYYICNEGIAGGNVLKNYIEGFK